MVDFIKEYQRYDDLGENERKKVVISCARHYEEQTLEYILKNLPRKKQKEFNKEPLEIIFVDKAKKDIIFGNNVITILDNFLFENKKDIFYKVAQNTICAVFVHLFYNTASDPNKKTMFSDIANGYLATITSESAKNTDFEQDMMNEMASVMGEIMDMGFEQ